MTNSAEVRVLANGLTVVLERLPHVPVVACQAWINAGSSSETGANAGVAHLHEHMLFKGTQRRQVGEIAREVEAAGGSINAWTSFDQTVYHLVLSGREVNLGLDILNDVLRNSAFDPEELAREKKVVLEEIRRAQDNPSRRFSNRLFQTCYPDHPYGRPVLGTAESVSEMTREQILDFYRGQYRPDNCTLVVVGDLEPDALFAEIESVFGGWAADGAPASDPDRGLDLSPSSVSITLEAVAETRLAVAWPAVGVAHPDSVALDVLSLVLGHGEASRLYKEVRRGSGLVHEVQAFPYSPAGPGLMVCSASLPGENIVEAVQAITKEFFALRQRQVSSSELATAVSILKAEAAYQRETVQGQARKRGHYQVVAGGVDAEEAYYTALDGLDVAELRNVARRYLTESPAIIIQAPEGTKVEESELRTAVRRSFDEFADKGKTTSKPVDGVHRFELDSGAVLLVRPEAGDVFAVRAMTPGGQRIEDDSQRGLGFLSACMWGAATAELQAAELSTRLSTLGGGISSFSGRNVLGLRGDFLAENADPGLNLFFGALGHHGVERVDFLREKDSILQRLRSRLDSGGTVAFDAFMAQLFPTHPYGRPLMGIAQEVAVYGAEDVEKHLARWVTPDRMIISMAGNIDPELAFEIAQGQLAGLGPSTTPVQVPILDAQTAVAHTPMDKEQCHLVLGAVGTTQRDPDRFALDVLTTVLSGQGGRLFRDLRDERSLAYSVSASNLEGWDPGYVMVHLATSPEKVAAAWGGLEEHLNGLCDRAISQEELERAIRYLGGSHDIDLQRAGARAMASGLGEMLGVGPNEFNEYRERLGEVTPEKVLEVARRFLTPDRRVRSSSGSQTV